jgi:hypothetical protein
MATRSPPRISRTLTKARKPLRNIPPINIAAGEPSGGCGIAMNFRKKFIPNTIKTKPKRQAVKL